MPTSLHVWSATIALVLGAGTVAWRKGTIQHRLTGGAYAGALLLVNGAALASTSATGGFGPFHALALVSLATLALGLAPLLLRPRSRAWASIHGITMEFSYVGLVAAGLSQLAAEALPAAAWIVVTLTSTATFTVGAVLIFRSSFHRASA